MNLRLRYEKIGDIAYVSHLDIIKMMERTVRRAQIPMQYSEGFNPHPKLSFSPALSLGVQSECEYIDILTVQEYDLKELLERLNQASAPGIRFLQAAVLPERFSSLTALITHTQYEVSLENFSQPSGARAFGQAAEDFMQEKSVWHKRQSKKGQVIEYDIRPLVSDLRYKLTQNSVQVYFTVASSSQQTLNPKILVAHCLNAQQDRPERIRYKKLQALHCDAQGCQEPIEKDADFSSLAKEPCS